MIVANEPTLANQAVITPTGPRRIRRQIWSHIGEEFLLGGRQLIGMANRYGARTTEVPRIAPAIAVFSVTIVIAP
jgi:hypothetical protein